MTDGDRDLRERFIALREEEDARVPELAGLLRRKHARGGLKSARRLIAATALLAAAIATVLFLRPALPILHRDAGSPVASIAEWKSPTAFLLDTPGRDLLQTVPSIGMGHVYEFAPRARKMHSRARTQF